MFILPQGHELEYKTILLLIGDCTMDVTALLNNSTPC